MPTEAAIAAPLPVFSTADFDADPYGIIEKFRGRVPVLMRTDGTYVVIDSLEVDRLITDPRTRQLEVEIMRMRGVHSGPLFDFFDQSMLMSNGQLHRRRRAPMSRAFGFRVIEELRPQIRAVANQQIDAVYTKGEMNFLDHYAAQIPARLICEILGIASEDIHRFTVWVYNLTRALSVSYTNEELPEIERATGELRDYVAGLIEARRASPQDDFLSRFIKDAEDQGALTPLEAIVQVMTVIVGGSDTTRAAITMMVGLLLTHREQWDAVCEDPGLIPGAALEALRYDAIVGSIPRVTLEDIKIGEVTIPANRVLSLSTLALMRDPAVYAHPERFDIRRTDHPKRHPAFGGGVHRCLGELLARAEMEESLAVLTQRLPALQLLGDAPSMHGHSGLRRIDGMRVGW